MNRIVSGFLIIIFLTFTFVCALNIQRVRADGAIYIRADGSIDPPTAPIATADNVTYFLTDSINGSIVAEKNHIVINGSGYSLQGSGSGNGISNGQVMYGITLSIDNIQIQGFSVGVFVGLVMSASCSLARSNITNNGAGIEVMSMHTYFDITANNIVNNSGVGILIGDCVGQISGNNIANNGGHGISAMDATCFISENNVTGNGGDGINLPLGGGGEIFENNISDNKGSGIRLGASGNRIFHNLFKTNGSQVTNPSWNTWDNGYPSGGNYWSDYSGPDIFSGSYQNETGGDGIGDTAYIIDSNNQDNYPLMHPYGSILNLNTSLAYLTIQSAIDAPETEDGHAIFVRNGTYYENVVLNKSLSLVGESKSSTIVDGKSGTVVFNVTAEKVNISGFTVQNASEGISLTNGCNNITDNIVMNNQWAGIYLWISSDNVIADNTIVNTGGSAWWSGAGILCNAFSSQNTIANNTLDNNTFGIVLTTSDHNILRGNRILNSAFGFTVENFFEEDIDTSNLIDGRPIYYLLNQKDLVIDNLTFPSVGFLGILDSENITVRDLDLQNNGIGILFANTNNSIIENLRIQNNRIGIHLFYSMNNTINDNLVAYNKIAGIYLEKCESNTIKRNMISDNFAGTGMTSENKNNTFYHNSFVNNEAQTTYRSYGPSNAEDNWDNGYPSGGNYWSDYNGTDADGDGIGDTPYIIDGNNTDHYPLMNPWAPPDIAVRDLSASKTVIGQGYTGTVNVTLENQGDKIEAFNTSVYANSTVINSESIMLATANQTLSFQWNTTGFAYGNYTINACVEPLLEELDIADNNYNCSSTIHVGVPGDISGPTQGVYDGTCNMRDIQYLILRFNTNSSSPNWNPNADINDDGTCNMRDIQIAILNFNKYE